MLRSKSIFIKKEFAEQDSPPVSESWFNLTNDERFLAINKIINSDKKYANAIELLNSSITGDVTVRLVDNPSAHDRGQLLLDFEEDIKSIVDTGLVLWAETKEDKSALRKLRGIEVKS